MATQTENHARKYAAFTVTRSQRNPDRVCAQTLHPLKHKHLQLTEQCIQICVYTWSGRFKHYTGRASPLQSNTSQMHLKPPVFGIGVFMHISASLSLPPHTSRQSHELNTKTRHPCRCVNSAACQKPQQGFVTLNYYCGEFGETAWHSGNCYMPIKQRIRSCYLL